MPERPFEPMAVPPSGRRFDVVCIGNALMDNLAFSSAEVIRSLGLAPGGMTLVDVPTTQRIAAAVGPTRMVPGGMVTNSAVGVASFGGTPAFIGAVAADELGDRFCADLEACGVHPVLERFPVDPDAPTGATGRCYVLVTPDAERTMATALGAGGRLDRTGIDLKVLSSAALAYLEGYILDLPDADAIVDRIVVASRAAGTSIALGLADSLLVERHHEVLTGLLADAVDLVFANEAELMALARTTDLGAALEALAAPGLAIVATRGPAGALVAEAGTIVEIPAVAVPEVVDATGAGDLFAAGVCFGVTHGFSLPDSARFGALAAAEVIGHLGARPERSLAELAAATAPPAR